VTASLPKLHAAWPALIYGGGSVVVLVSTLAASADLRPLILLLHLLAFAAVTAATMRIGKRVDAGARRPSEWARRALLALSSACAALILSYPLLRGGAPLLAALATNDFDAISGVRSTAIPAGDPLGFVLRMAIHGAAPVLILFLFLAARRGVAITAAAAMVGGAALLLFKSMPVIMLAPLAVHSLLERRWRRLAMVVAALGAILLLQVAATNPHLRGYRTIAAADLVAAPAFAAATPIRPEGPGRADALRISLEGILERALKRPGEGVAAWLSLVPERIAYTRGCSIRAVARRIGCEHRNLPREVYDLTYPEFVARGLRGSLDVPHYVQDFALFGPIGLAVSGAAAAFGLLALRLAAPGAHPACQTAILMTAFVTGTPELLLSEGGILAAALIVLVGLASGRAAGEGET
jgi:hypothetical protein